MRAAGELRRWLVVVGVTTLGSLGIYFGRFLRWNSSDVFQAPLALADQLPHDGRLRNGGPRRTVRSSQVRGRGS